MTYGRRCGFVILAELKVAVSILRDYQLGFTGVKWWLSIYRGMAVGLAIISGAMFHLRVVVSGSRRLPAAGEVVRVGAYLLMALVAVGVWDFLRTRRRLRMAEALADSLADPSTPGGGEQEVAGHAQHRSSGSRL
jgi:hypothetical protein